MSALLSTPEDIIVDDTSFDDDDVSEITLPAPLPPPVHPLTLSREECFYLSQGGGYWNGRGAEYSKDTGTDYELVEEVNVHLWNEEVRQSILSGGDCPVCRGQKRRQFIYCGTKTNFYWLYSRICG
jgi:hypothetical protein